jgi:hypothetical protein
MVTVGPPKITYDDARHAYTLDGEKVPSVTTILDACTSKPALPWWGMRVGLAAMVRIMEKYPWAELANANTYEEVLSGVPAQGREFFQPKRRNPKPKTLLEMATLELKLSTNHVKEDAGERGTIIHNAMEQLGLGADIDDIVDGVPEEHRGYVEGMCDWWLDHEPEFLEQEIIVASRTHQYAGRFDFVVRYRSGPHAGQIVLGDLKTSKRVYRSHLVQLDAYDLAYEEMGLEPPGWRDANGHAPIIAGDWAGFDARQVIHVTPTGGYQIVTSKIPRGHFAHYANLHRQLLLEATLHPEL